MVNLEFLYKIQKAFNSHIQLVSYHNFANKWLDLNKIIDSSKEISENIRVNIPIFFLFSTISMLFWLITVETLTLKMRSWDPSGWIGRKRVFFMILC
jgi:hypothetical protein